MCLSSLFLLYSRPSKFLSACLSVSRSYSPFPLPPVPQNHHPSLILLLCLAYRKAEARALVQHSRHALDHLRKTADSVAVECKSLESTGAIKTVHFETADEREGNLSPQSRIVAFAEAQSAVSGGEAGRVGRGEGTSEAKGRGSASGGAADEESRRQQHHVQGGACSEETILKQVEESTAALLRERAMLLRRHLQLERKLLAAATCGSLGGCGACASAREAMVRCVSICTSVPVK